MRQPVHLAGVDGDIVERTVGAKGEVDGASGVGHDRLRRTDDARAVGIDVEGPDRVEDVVAEEVPPRLRAAEDKRAAGDRRAHTGAVVLVDGRAGRADGRATGRLRTLALRPAVVTAAAHDVDFFDGALPDVRRPEPTAERIEPDAERVAEAGREDLAAFADLTGVGIV